MSEKNEHINKRPSQAPAATVKTSLGLAIVARAPADVLNTSVESPAFWTP